MDLVVDANILFSALIKKGNTSYLLLKEELHLFSQEYIFEEFKKYEEKLFSKTYRSREDFNGFFEILERRINIYTKTEIKPYFKKASEICPDKNDIPYFALSMLLNAPIWSNDKLLKEKQSTIDIYTTEDLLNYFIL